MTMFEYLDGKRVHVISPHGLFQCDAREVNRHHYGIWHDTVMYFVPPTYNDDPNYFSDGTPVVDDYTGDKSGKFWDDCVVCGEPTNGSRYCSASCQQRDELGEA